MILGTVGFGILAVFVPFLLGCIVCLTVKNPPQWVTDNRVIFYVAIGILSVLIIIGILLAYKFQ
jgi:hypothetical protein